MYSGDIGMFGESGGCCGRCLPWYVPAASQIRCGREDSYDKDDKLHSCIFGALCNYRRFDYNLFGSFCCIVNSVFCVELYSTERICSREEETSVS